MLSGIVIGLGSMGMRRIRCLKKIDDSIRIIGCDNSEFRCEKAFQEQGVVSYTDLGGAISEQSFDFAIVSTPPLTHSNLIIHLLENNIPVFSEMNLVADGYAQIQNLMTRNAKYFLSSTMLYREDLSFIRSHISSAKAYAYTYHIGQYLPDWHPWESVHDFFVSNSRTNGCREILAIELPWIVETFGTVTNISTQSNSLTSIGLEYPDVFQINIQHETGTIGQIMVDLVSPIATRSFRAVCEHSLITWQGTPDTAEVYKNKKKDNFVPAQALERDERYASFIIEDAYIQEISHFINFLKDSSGCDEPLHTLQKDLYIIDLMDRIGV